MTDSASPLGIDAVSLESLLAGPDPILALAPMQDVTDLPFWGLVQSYGGADLYYTEYFRVHGDSRLEKWILESITQNPTRRPVIAQMIGNDIPSLVRTAKELQNHPIAAIDLNLGCPAPVVYRKCAGGGLLRDLPRIDAILGALRDAVQIKFTVKTRIGFDDPSIFEALLAIFARHSLDLLTVHGRTVAERYRSGVHYDFIARAVEQLPCPVLANGNVCSATKAAEVLNLTRARGVMIGRAAIRNPWIFTQIRQQQSGQQIFQPTGHDVLVYIRALYETTSGEIRHELQRVQKMKKYLNFLALGVEPTGRFLHDIRRAITEADFFQICNDHLAHGSLMPLEPFSITMPDHDMLAGEHG